MIVFETNGKITAINDKTNLTHKFDVPDNINQLKITYSYSPKTLEDREKAVNIIRQCFDKYDERIINRPADYLPIKNLITLSLDDNGTYRGAAHRQANQQEHIISKDFASPGFIKGEIHSGEWSIVLNVHYVACDVDYSLLVEGGEE